MNENLNHTYFKVFFALFYYLDFIWGKFLFRLLILLDLSQQYLSVSAGSLLAVRWRVCRFHSHQVYPCLSSGLMAASTRSQSEMLHRQQGVPLLGFLAILYRPSNLYVISWLGFLSDLRQSLCSPISTCWEPSTCSQHSSFHHSFLSREAFAQHFWFPAMGTAPCSHEWHPFSAHYPSSQQCQLLGLEYSIPRAKCSVILFHF